MNYSLGQIKEDELYRFYYESVFYKNGMACLIYDPKCFHLLLPDSMLKQALEMKNSEYIIITKGVFEQPINIDPANLLTFESFIKSIEKPEQHNVVEILFENLRNDPLSSRIGAKQMSITLNAEYHNKVFDFKMYSKEGVLYKTKAYILSDKGYNTLPETYSSFKSQTSLIPNNE